MKLVYKKYFPNAVKAGNCGTCGNQAMQCTVNIAVVDEKNSLAGGTLDIGQYREVIPHTSKACQDLER